MNFEQMNTKDRIAIVITLVMIGPFPFIYANNPNQIIYGYIIALVILVPYWGYRFVVRDIGFIKKDSKNICSPDELAKWGKLKDDGHITEQEFNDAKNKLLNKE